MTHFKPFIIVSILAVVCSALAAAPPERRGGKPDAKDANHLTGILSSVDVKHGTLTLDDVGVDVDEALDRKLKKQGKENDGRGPATPRTAGEQKAQVVIAITAKSKLYVKFRTSPSVANNVEQSLTDLQPMVGYPVTVTIGQNGEHPVASEVVVWRGTPWK